MRDIKHYRIGQGLGQGAIGNVRMVMHRARKEVYALKQVVYHTSVSRTFIPQCSLAVDTTMALDVDQKWSHQVNAQFKQFATRGESQLL